MIPNIDRYRKDLERLIHQGEDLYLAMQLECFPEEVEKEIRRLWGTEAEALIKRLPNVKDKYQAWYSEAKALIRQLLPDRLDDFVRHYEKPKSRKEITFENYRIDDYLQGLRVTTGWEKTKLVGPDAAIPQLRQQISIVKSVATRFESSLVDIRQLAQADLFDSELDTADELLRKKFSRAAGAIAGVVLERHLQQVCVNHAVKLSKKSPTISDLNDLLKDAGVLDTAQWRYVQHLGDIRNLCSHNKDVEPSKEQVVDLVGGVRKITKTVF